MPYIGRTATTWLPRDFAASSTAVNAAIPDENAAASSAPSRSAIARSVRSVVGLKSRWYTKLPCGESPETRLSNDRAAASRSGVG